ncbi:hypothetical protein BTR14_18385 [Rhizobium rhizosphaerae]|uniref:Glycosyltransferase subfamily 4-like N-terminal domain-containing protein n=1 Tax=Xaviernesmea rhizosphaerae TaxID=1672749 RepID=A0ABX3P8D8_9HYPH|nr:glycosyltransferase family 4 protein [Xaviernesmea rhizosphaerae]OQP84601.1 hypothetical protein BTR14_18385 [Xaviernesmea rhizosphaerae]
MRIAITNALYPTPAQPSVVGGAEIYVRQLSQTLRARGHEILILRVSPDDRVHTETVDGILVRSLPVRNLFPPFRQPANPLLRLAWHAIDDRYRAPAATADCLDAFRPDLLHSHTFNGLSTDVWQVAKAKGLPIVHTLHDYYLTCPRCSRFNKGHDCEATCGSCALLTAVRRRRTALVDAVVGVSAKTLHIHRQEGLFAGADQHVIRHAPDESIAYSPLPTTDGPLIIGYIGRFSAEKGIRLLLEAVSRLEPGSVRLLLAGKSTPEEQAELRQVAPGVDIEFLGYVAPPSFYQRIQVLAVPSIWHEPGPLVLIEAQAAGRPAIGTPFGGIPENLDDGRTGWLSEPEPESMASAIRRLVEDRSLLTRAHHALGEQRALRRSFDDVVSSYEAIYDNMADRRQR